MTTTKEPATRPAAAGPANAPAKIEEERRSASGRWSAVRRVRLPHKPGLPLSSGGCGDGGGIET